MTDALSVLRRGAYGILGRELGDEETVQFHKYLNMLMKWQETQRLLGSGDPEWIVQKIFLDSLLFLHVLPPSAQGILDVGSGAGVPGIPLKIVKPHLQLTMVESRRRRASFLSSTVRDIPLLNTLVIYDRLEAVASELTHKFDVVVARCAGDATSLLSLSVNFLRPGGMVIVSGPPDEYALPLGRWVTVPGVGSSETRRFAVLQN